MNCFVADASLKEGSNIFSNRKKNEENTENAAEEGASLPVFSSQYRCNQVSCLWNKYTTTTEWNILIAINRLDTSVLSQSAKPHIYLFIKN